jgi:hypothetical protein
LARIAKHLRKRLIVPVRKLAFHAIAPISARRYREDFASVETFCVFLGEGRSGSSILGALLDAHEDAVIAHELNVLERLETDVSRDRIFLEILDNSAKEARRGREATGYAYGVPNQWQGRFRRLRVIGDKKAGGSSKILSVDPDRIQALADRVGVELRGIHCLRNPFDNITTIASRRRGAIESRREDFEFRPEDIEVRREDIECAIAGYFETTRTIEALKRHCGDRILDLRHEDFVAEPKGGLREMCTFLGLRTSAEYLEDCAKIVYTNPNRSRDGFDWPRDLISTVETQMREFDFLAGYGWQI